MKSKLCILQNISKTLRYGLADSDDWINLLMDITGSIHYLNILNFNFLYAYTYVVLIF